MGQRVERNPQAQFDRIERRKRAVDLRVAGVTWEQVATQAGYTSRWAAYQDISRWLSRSATGLREQTETLRELELMRLDRALRAIWPQVLAGDTQSVNTMLKIMEQRARLYGVPIRHEVLTIDVVEAQIMELERQLADSGRPPTPRPPSLPT